MIIIPNTTFLNKKDTKQQWSYNADVKILNCSKVKVDSMNFYFLMLVLPIIVAYFFPLESYFHGLSSFMLVCFVLFCFVCFLRGVLVLIFLGCFEKQGPSLV